MHTHTSMTKTLSRLRLLMRIKSKEKAKDMRVLVRSVCLDFRDGPAKEA